MKNILPFLVCAAVLTGCGRSKDTLLHKTDLRAVLVASREVIQTRREYKRDRNMLGGESPEESFIAPDDVKLPVAIRNLHASYIGVRDDQLEIEFGGGFHHLGFIAYPENATNTPTARIGFQKLLDGLWFYEDTN